MDMLRPSIFGENLFDDFFEDFAGTAKGLTKYGKSAAVMNTDVKENSAGYEIHIELPGYKKEDIKAELTDGMLTISASTNAENDKTDENGKYIRRERFSGNCSRSFYVGEAVKQEDIKARFEDGILKVFVPKKEEKPEIEKKQYILIEG